VPALHAGHSEGHVTCTDKFSGSTRITHRIASRTAAASVHVASKRYLCAVDAAYLDELSAASRHSLTLQGGPFSAAEAEEFRRGRYAEAAVRLRHYDDLAKVPGLAPPPLEHYRAVLEAVRIAPAGAP
jgi:predicted HD phosphohydrolase